MVVFMFLRVYLLVRLFHDVASPYDKHNQAGMRSRPRHIHFVQTLKLLLNRNGLLVHFAWW